MPELGDRQLAPLQRILWRIDSGNDVEEFVLPLELAVRGIGEHVGSDGQRSRHLAADGGRQVATTRAPEFPEAGEARHAGGLGAPIGWRRVDQAGAAAVIDSQERAMQLWRNDFLGMPGGVLGGQQVEPILGLGKDLTHQLTKPPVKLITLRAAGFGEDESPFVNISPQPFAGFRAEVEELLS